MIDDIESFLKGIIVGMLVMLCTLSIASTFIDVSFSPKQQLQLIEIMERVKQ